MSLSSLSISYCCSSSSSPGREEASDPSRARKTKFASTVQSLSHSLTRSLCLSWVGARPAIATVGKGRWRSRHSAVQTGKCPRYAERCGSAHHASVQMTREDLSPLLLSERGSFETWRRISPAFTTKAPALAGTRTHRSEQKAQTSAGSSMHIRCTVYISKHTGT